MATFKGTEGKEYSYHIDKNLLVRWDKLKNKGLVKTDEDRVYIVDGRERTGKSVFTFQQAKYLDPSFNLSRVCFTPDEFLNCIRTAKSGQAIVFDEAFRGLSSKASQSKVNKKLVQAMMEMGQRNLIVFIVLPTFFLLELYVAVLRTNALFHVYKDKKGTRRFRIYNYAQKSLLYKYGKKKGFDYSIPRVKVRGRFFNKYAIDEEEYRKKKEKSFRGMEIYKEEEEGRISIERKFYLELATQILKYFTKKGDQGMVELLKLNKKPIGRTTIVENRKVLREKGVEVICQMS